MRAHLSSEPSPCHSVTTDGTTASAARGARKLAPLREHLRRRIAPTATSLGTDWSTGSPSKGSHVCRAWPSRRIGGGQAVEQRGGVRWSPRTSRADSRDEYTHPHAQPPPKRQQRPSPG